MGVLELTALLFGISGYIVGRIHQAAKQKVGDE